MYYRWTEIVHDMVQCLAVVDVLIQREIFLGRFQGA